MCAVLCIPKNVQEGGEGGEGVEGGREGRGVVDIQYYCINALIHSAIPVRKARLREIRSEMLNSDKLKVNCTGHTC